MQTALPRRVSAIWAASFLSVRRDTEGEPVSVVRMSNDITELKRTTEALRISEATARISLRERLSQGILTVDREGRIFYANDILQTLF